MWNPESTISTSPVIALSRVAQQKSCCLTDLGRFDIPPKRRALAIDVEDVRKPADPCGGQRLDGTCRNRVHANVPGAEIGGEVADCRLQRSLRNAHHVVVRKYSLAPQIRQRQDAPPPRFSIRGAAALARAMSEYAEISSAILKPSRVVFANGVVSSSRGANAAPWTTKSRPPNSCSTFANTDVDVGVGRDITRKDERGV